MMPTNFLFCKKHNLLSVVQCRTCASIKVLFFVSGILEYGFGIVVMLPLFSLIPDIFMISAYNFYVTSQNLETEKSNSESNLSDVF